MVSETELTGTVCDGKLGPDLCWGKGCVDRCRMGSLVRVVHFEETVRNGSPRHVSQGFHPNVETKVESSFFFEIEEPINVPSKLLLDPLLSQSK